MRDPYDVLGVSRTASEGDIKSAFRKLAKKHHPDQNQDDPKAKERFSEVNAAYEIVGDKDKRKQFDRGEIDAEGKPRFQGFEGFSQGGGNPFGGTAGGNPFGGGGGGRTFRWSSSGGGNANPFSNDDILSEILGGGFGRRTGGGGAGAGARSSSSRGEDVSATAAVTLEQLISGEKIRVDLPTGRTLEVAVPTGTRAGQVIRLKGQGRPGAFGGPAGDALVTVELVPHPVYRVEGETLRRDVPVTLDEAVLGGKVRVDTLDGPVTLSIPANSSGGRTLRLRGRGLPKAGGARGDMLVNLRIVLPEGGDAELEALMKKWRETKRYSARDEEAGSA